MQTVTNESGLWTKLLNLMREMVREEVERYMQQNLQQGLDKAVQNGIPAESVKVQVVMDGQTIDSAVVTTLAGYDDRSANIPVADNI